MCKFNRPIPIVDKSEFEFYRAFLETSDEFDGRACAFYAGIHMVCLSSRSAFGINPSLSFIEPFSNPLINMMACVCFMQEFIWFAYHPDLFSGYTDCEHSAN